MNRLFSVLLLVLTPLMTKAENRMLTTAGLPIWDSAPLLYLVEQQPLSDKGITFDFQPWRAPEELGAALARADIQIASTPGILAPIFSAKGMKLSLLGTSAPAGNIKILSRNNGGEIAVPFKGGMPDLILRSLETVNDLKPRYTGTPPEAMQLFLAGQVSAAFLAEPLATAVSLQSKEPVETRDACALWKSAHGVKHCPATGVYMGVAMDGRDAELIGRALENAYIALAYDPEKAASLLKAQFAALERAPLVPAFQRMTPAFQNMCETTWLNQTLQALESVVPFALTSETLLSVQCKD